MPSPTESPAFTDDEAASWFATAKASDPFPDILPALLNSADIDDYVRATGMISPYFPSRLKSASYEAQIGKLAIYWDSEGRQQEVDLENEKSVYLYPNSLIYFMTLPFFRLPDYMALRFNLRITNVHKGLLLGTGPLVDPGFEGRLLVPVHNFTTNTYKFEYQEAFIWIEFTRISQNENWVKLSNELQKGRQHRSGVYKPFPDEKKQRIDEPQNSVARNYLAGAAPHRPLMNAIPEIHETAKEAKERVNKIYVWGTVAFVSTIAVAIVGYFVSVHPIVQESLSLSVSTNDLVTETRMNVDQHNADILQLQQEVRRLTDMVEALSDSDQSTVQEELNAD